MISFPVLLGVLLIVVLYWETQRVPVLIALMVVFALGGAMIILGIRKRYRLRPGMLTHSLKELSRDIEQLKPEHMDVVKLFVFDAALTLENWLCEV